ncbi:MAG TPA: carbohydrate kinase family protein [Candidatus Sulfotelmatobacter sp.]|nr:carbohydrate kinase family protein [Candidatus Sulfotelmatobacter sp.]
MSRFDVTVVGELNLDLILYGLPEKLEPERELLANRLALTLGSSSAIFAHNLSVLGSKVGFISRIGDDPLGQIALDRLAAGGVDVSRVRRVSGPTTTGLTVILPRADCRNILTYPGTMDEMCFEDLDLDYLADSKHFHLSSFFLHRRLRPRIPELFQKMKQKGLTTSLDTNDDPEDRWGDDLYAVLKHVDVFLANEREAKKIARADNLESAVASLSPRVPVLVVKLGAEGALARGPCGQVRCPALKVEVVDPVGAGDSFDAGFVHQYVRGAALTDCLAYGNTAGAFSTTRPGGTEAFRDRRQCQDFFNRMLEKRLP